MGFSKEEQKEFDIKDLKHIANEIQNFSNLYSVILKKIAERIEKDFETEKNGSGIKPLGYFK